MYNFQFNLDNCIKTYCADVDIDNLFHQKMQNMVDFCNRGHWLHMLTICDSTGMFISSTGGRRALHNVLR